MTRDAKDDANATGAPQSLGVMFECCHIYRRIFKRPDGSAYEGRCPKCGHPARVLVGEGGSASRVWRST